MRCHLFLKSRFKVTDPDYLHHICYDSVIYGFTGNQLKILILEYHNTMLFALPGNSLKKTKI